MDLARLEHIVVLMLENRSFDHALGALALDRPEVDGVAPGRVNVDTTGRAWAQEPLTGPRARRFDADPPHGSARVAEALGVGEPEPMSGFVRAFEHEHGSDAGHGDVMRYLRPADMPATHWLAAEYTVCHRWFSAIPTGTIPNRLYSIAGQSLGLRDNPAPADYVFGLEVATIFDAIAAEQWAVYAGALPLMMMVKGLRRPLMRGAAGSEPRLRKLARFREDAEAGRLPRLTWIEPSYNWTEFPLFDPFFPEPNDDHPPSDVLAGQSLVRFVYDALTADHDRWSKTLLVITYDEHGGFYDHVPPPFVAPVDDGGDGFLRRGVRVPALVVSPYAARGAVIGRPDDVWDHCSILKTLCDWFGLPAFTPRIAAGDLAGLTDLLTDAPRTDIPRMPDLPGVERIGRAPRRAPPPAMRHEDRVLLDGDLPRMVEEMRLQLEKDYPAEFGEHFPELAGMPPIARTRAKPSRSRP